MPGQPQDMQPAPLESQSDGASNKKAEDSSKRDETVGLSLSFLNTLSACSRKEAKNQVIRPKDAHRRHWSPSLSVFQDHIVHRFRDMFNPAKKNK